MDFVASTDEPLDQPENAGNDSFRSAAIDAARREDGDLHGLGDGGQGGQVFAQEADGFGRIG